MIASYKSDHQKQMFRGVLQELRALRYSGELLVDDGYEFGDWFNPLVPTRRIAAAAFGQTPVSYDTACFGVVVPTETSGIDAIDGFRALGAPIVFEVGDEFIRQWNIGASKKTTVSE